MFACLCCVYFFSPIGLRPLAICILCITYCIFFQGRSLGLMIDACLPASKKLENVEKVCHEHVEHAMADQAMPTKLYICELLTVLKRMDLLSFLLEYVQDTAALMMHRPKSPRTRSFWGRSEV